MSTRSDPAGAAARDRQRERTPADRAAALAALRELSQAVLAISRHLDTNEALQTIVRTARDLVGAEYAALGIPDGSGSFARFLVEGISDEQWAAIGPLPRQHGMLGVMLHDPHPQRLPDITADPRFNWWPRAHPRLTGFIGVPIRDGDEILGALFLGNTALGNTGAPGPAGSDGEDSGFTQEDEDLLTVLAAHAAIALTHAKLYERERELAILSERTRLARELHDAVTQKLFALRLTAEAAAGLLPVDPERAATHLAQIAVLAREAVAELRAVVGELRPAELEQDGLALAMRKQVTVLDHAYQSGGGPRIAFVDDPFPQLPPAQEQVVLRVAQEALHNAIRHARAGVIELRLGPAGLPRARRTAVRAAGAALTVTDDGVGFATGPGGPDGTAGRGLGLTSMRERAASVGGTLSVTSAPGQGTTIRLEVPGVRKD
ncbi:MAG TPA: GAF domain-containing sensor histidine kinase [Actinocrinis sp.]|nr:GAF domain-containing sensor histidine kinase [Actinocrinis sp.]